MLFLRFLCLRAFIILTKSAAQFAVKATPDIIRVPQDFPTIQKAINAANPWDTILVAKGTYYEYIVVNKSLTIIGEDPLITIIDGQSKGPIVEITVGYVKISNFTIRNAKPYTAIWIEDKTGKTLYDIKIIDNIITNNWMGIAAMRCNDLTINNTKFFSNSYAIRAYSSNFVQIINNFITSSLQYGIYLYSYSTNNLIKNNTLEGNRYNILIEWSDNNTIRRNTITSTASLSGYGIRLTTSHYVEIYENTIQLNYRGIVLWDNSTHNRFYLNNFINNTIQVEHYNTLPDENIWDTDVFPGTRGNYWSDYAGVDDGSGVGRNGEQRIAGDGVGDTLIPHLSVDWYPLMNPYSPWPIAYFTYNPEYPRVHEVVTFDASLSAGNIVSYTWNFGDGTPPVTESDPIITHVFDVKGNYTVTLTVIDREGLSNSTSKIVPILGFLMQLDIYTQKEPYGGKGFNQTSDSFSPQEIVTLYGLVIYNGDPVPNKIVAFNIYDPNGTFIAFRSNITDENGITCVTFRIETQAIFGIYLVVGSVEIAGEVALDYLRFEVGWIVNIIALETVDGIGTPKIVFHEGETIYVNILLRNLAFTSKNATLTIEVDDSLKTPVAVAKLQIEVDPGWLELKLAFSLNIPRWAYIGSARVYANAYTNLLWERGVSYCPETVVSIIIQA